MGLGLWKRQRILRQFKEPVYSNGIQTYDYDDVVIMADVQTTDRSTTTGPDGDRSVQSLKVFCDFRVNVADQQSGMPGDMIWFQGKWFECRSSRLSENTFLSHWTSTFVQCLNQPEPPNEEVLLK